MRLFLALELAESIVYAIDDAVAPLRTAVPGLAWVPPARRHLTLKFIGDDVPAGIDAVVAAIDTVARTHRPFAMDLAGIGTFPNFRRARVVWIGVEGDARLELLHHDIEVACVGVGIEVEGRPFRPHVTLARVRTALDAEQARALARAARRVAFTATQDVAAITLFDSVPAPAGSHYRRLHSATLGGR